MKKEYVSYSEAFKMEVVSEISGGKFATIENARRSYGIRGTTTIQKWIKKYGREDLLPKRVRVETMAERDEIKEAKARIRDLERALADSHMDYCLERACLEIACEKTGTTREDLKKKNVRLLCNHFSLRTCERDRGWDERQIVRKRAVPEV
jgi:transposase-like protein